MDDILHIIALSRVPDIGPVTLKSLIAHFGSPESVFRSGPEELKRVSGVGGKRADTIARSIKEFKGIGGIEKELDGLQKKGVRAITFKSADYPEMLREIPAAPCVLYVKGEMLKEDKFALAIVGSRKPTPYGVSAAERIAGELSSMGFTIVSGLARGIDTAAHVSAVKGGGRSIAVLGSGINVPYPLENKGLMERISKSGYVVSEFPPDSEPSRETFPQRNRLISGLSLGVLVVEAARASGALITAGYALEQGREVFSVPGSIYSETSGGTNDLIKKGAKMVMAVGDIVEELAPVLKGFIKARKESRKPEVSGEEKLLCDILSGEPVHIDDLSRESGLPASKALSLLLGLELRGVVKQTEGKRFFLT